MNTNALDNHEVFQNNTVLSDCAIKEDEDRVDVQRLIVGETDNTVVVPSGTGRVDDGHQNDPDDVLAMMMLMDEEGMMLDGGGWGLTVGEGHSCGDGLVMYMTSPAFSKAVQEHRCGARYVTRCRRGLLRRHSLIYILQHNAGKLVI
jgi:hypothetical protein